MVCDVPPQPLMHIADGDRLAAVLTNFLDNAAKYAPEPSPIEVRMSQAAERVRIAVTDHGPGIAPEDQRAAVPALLPRAEPPPTRRAAWAWASTSAAPSPSATAARWASTASPAAGATFWLDLRLGQS